MMIARGLLQAGARVVISSRNAQACAEAQKHLSEFGDVQAIPADLSRHDECRRLSELVTADDERLDILVNNAGAMWDEPLATFPVEAWDTVVDLNLKSPFWLVQALLPALRVAGAPDDPARIIRTSPSRYTPPRRSIRPRAVWKSTLLPRNQVLVTTPASARPSYGVIGFLWCSLRTSTTCADSGSKTAKSAS